MLGCRTSRRLLRSTFRSRSARPVRSTLYDDDTHSTNARCVDREVHDEILEQHGIDIPMKHVIMTSDETDEGWWDEVGSYGWKRIDHDGQRTVERYSRW